MDIYGDHTLLSRASAASSGFQNWSLGVTIPRYDSAAGICHMLEHPHLRLTRDDAPKWGHGFWHTKLANILLYF